MFGLYIGRKMDIPGVGVFAYRNLGNLTNSLVFSRGVNGANSSSHLMCGYVVQPLVYSPILYHLSRQMEGVSFYQSEPQRVKKAL